ncbi:hypothetical protein [Leifsonia sp. Leaf264]|uniref:hypothetical protein n=1 Tax=Leifsonia sp. Leaf264 TaxID=1736314 RepID=UPI0006F49EF5|nr:hypothetical protein [Leifsonia sp. Leaf264]KQO97501.1 hypothetical protein ASF30_13805 [Leifsonia sp. Leaf264]
MTTNPEDAAQALIAVAAEMIREAEQGEYVAQSQYVHVQAQSTLLMVIASEIVEIRKMLRGQTGRADA